MTEWNSLLDVLATTPRENGTAAIAEATTSIVQLCEQAGLSTELFAYTAHPYRLRLAGVLALVGGAAYSWTLVRGRAAVALFIAVVTPALLLIELDRYVPLFGWLGAQTQHHVEATIEPAVVEQQLIIAGHFDSKTDLLDHVVRAPIEILGVPIALLMMVAAGLHWWRRREGRALGRLGKITVVLAVFYGAFSFIALTGGEFASERSPGTLDNGAATAVMVRLGERLRQNPPERTRVTLLFLSGEEIGVQGSWVCAAERFATAPERPTAVVNLEFLGAATDFAVFKGESFATRTYPPAPWLVEAFDQEHRRQRGKPLWVTWYAASTDARSFLAHGVPAMTLLNALPGHALPRGMHSPRDNRSRIVDGGLDAALELLDATVRRLDAAPLGAAPERL